ncbi:hypothetical protein [Hymenobacter sp. GOD-10R]|uniref:hypothetical protein n=1 Tax=Hymenobacter sp. GOD-10R TaxID=3093922 RepID=UPI002D765867|nr:hypothetical protein [Hymenobacter sp. GOD-10R]WRQ31808.1 hypothetical protein SD425_28585 [Hymenobacter sp. GOD-10R]
MLAEDGTFLLYEDGCFIAAEETQKVIVLSFNNLEYNLTDVCQTGLQAMQQFINMFDQTA